MFQNLFKRIRQWWLLRRWCSWTYVRSWPGGYWAAVSYDEVHDRWEWWVRHGPSGWLVQGRCYNQFEHGDALYEALDRVNVNYRKARSGLPESEPEEAID